MRSEKKGKGRQEMRREREGYVREGEIKRRCIDANRKEEMEKTKKT